MVDFKAIVESAKKEREWRKTELGRLFTKFEDAAAEYWIADCDRKSSMEQIIRLDNALKIARRELLIKVRGW